MARTLRTNRRDKYRRKAREGQFYPYVSTQCRHHGVCPWCASGRQHAAQRRAPA